MVSKLFGSGARCALALLVFALLAASAHAGTPTTTVGSPGLGDLSFMPPWAWFLQFWR